ncbi:hypothetical protein [uncultured Maribacter sp.]|uniref:hypothetical protein n=1 Tax=uncultured Maribacter sp. TaxID=431308 RepID=UPI00262A4D5F|nr:hypothetical protein [uncultured Maribacter sp.]
MKKNIGLVIVILVIGYNIYDYFKVKNDSLSTDIENCTNKFMATNPNIDKNIAEKYCKCAIENIGEKYKNSTISTEKILENEQSRMQDCFDYAKKAKQ